MIGEVSFGSFVRISVRGRLSWEGKRRRVGRVEKIRAQGECRESSEDDNNF